MTATPCPCRRKQPQKAVATVTFLATEKAVWLVLRGASAACSPQEEAGTGNEEGAGSRHPRLHPIFGVCDRLDTDPCRWPAVISMLFPQRF